MIRFEIYPERQPMPAGFVLTGNWRWRARAANNQITAGSQESFPSRGNATRAARRFARSIRNAYQWIDFIEVEK